MSDSTYTDLLKCIINCIEDMLKLCVFTVIWTKSNNSKFDENKAAFMGKRVGEGIGY